MEYAATATDNAAKPAWENEIEETKDQIVFRSRKRGGLTFKISKNQKWRGLIPLPSVNAHAVEELAVRIGYDRQRVLDATSVMSRYVKELTPDEAAKRLAEDLGIPAAEIWRYFIDAMYIV